MPLKSWIRGWLLFGALYLTADALVHLFNIRLTDTLGLWPESAIVFSGFISQLYASFVLLLVLLILEIQKDIKKYANLILILGGWSFIHGIFLTYQGMNGLSNSFQNIQSLSVWLSFYNQLEDLEGILLIIFGTMVVLWRIKNGKNS